MSDEKNQVDNDTADQKAAQTEVLPEETTPGNSKHKIPKKAKMATIGLAAIAAILIGANAAGLFHQHTWKAPTCTEPKTCSECGATEGEALGHKYSEEDKAATCTAPGKRVFTCERCGDTYSEETGEPAKGHTPGEAALNTTLKKMVVRCTTCGETIEQSDITREAVDAAMTSLQVTLDDCYKVESNSDYKYLYKDQIGIDITNHSDKVMRNANIVVCAWDENGYPVTVDLMYSFRDSDKAMLGFYDENLAAGATWSSRAENYGWDLDGTGTYKISQVRGYVESVEYTDGTAWQNPYGEAWESLYVGKNL